MARGREGGKSGAPPHQPPQGGQPPQGRRGNGRPGTRGYRINLAVTNLSNALMANGLDSSSALRFARMALTQKGVTIGRRGFIHYQGSRYNANQFATSPLARYVTGAKAKAMNEAAIKSDPNYQAAISQLALTQQQGQAGLDAQRRSALLDFGDPNFVRGDPTLAAAVGANPFSTSRLLQQQYDQQRQGLASQANVIGTSFGGGLASGNVGAQHAFAGSQANASSALNNLLGSLTQQGTSLSQNQALGGQQALLQTQQNLAQEGVLSASAPKYSVGHFNLFRQKAQRQRQPRVRPPGIR